MKSSPFKCPDSLTTTLPHRPQRKLESFQKEKVGKTRNESGGPGAFVQGVTAHLHIWGGYICYTSLTPRLPADYD